MSNATVPQVYTWIVDDVIAKVAEPFANMGVHDDVLRDLENRWRTKLIHTKCAPFPPLPGAPAAAGRTNTSASAIISAPQQLPQQQSTQATMAAAAAAALQGYHSVMGVPQTIPVGGPTSAAFDFPGLMGAADPQLHVGYLGSVSPASIMPYGALPPVNSAAAAGAAAAASGGMPRGVLPGR
ncbi:hypothetical protein HK405_001155, partial [Cladochytrium tenue]